MIRAPWARHHVSPPAPPKKFPHNGTAACFESQPFFVLYGLETVSRRQMDAVARGPAAGYPQIPAYPLRC